MARSRLTAEEQIIYQDKKLGISFTEVLAEITAGNGRMQRSIPLRRKDIRVRLIIIVTKPQHRSTWSTSLLLNDIRADGIDYHNSVYTDTEGAKRIGWHRHIWSVQHRSGEKVRKHLADFDPPTAEEFIREALKIMKVSLKQEGGDAGGQMPIG